MGFGRRFLTKLLSTSGEAERLDRFELIADIASGGMATVYLARLSGVAGFQRLVAIKRLHPHLAREREFVDMFLDEARLAARIHHPNVVPIQEIGQSERGYYLVMDYIEGDTAARLFARAAQSGTRVPIEVAIRILLDALSGLHAAHELKDDNGKPLEIVHRDVSPQNILVGVDGTSRLTDFGVARAASRLSSTRTGQLKGKLAYMAPEQARGADLDRRADVFAMGIVAWEALAFRRLFKGDGEAETLNRVLYEPIPQLKEAAPSLPDELAAVVMKALDRDPGQRYATAADFADALENAARAVQKVGSAREVAAFLESMVGTDLSQTRDAVRAWLARSEPSRNENATHLREAAASITRVETPGRREQSHPNAAYGPATASGSFPQQAGASGGYPQQPGSSGGYPQAVPSQPASGRSGPYSADPISSVSSPGFLPPGHVSQTPPSTMMPDHQASSNKGAVIGLSVIAAILVCVIAIGGTAGVILLRRPSPPINGSKVEPTAVTLAGSEGTGGASPTAASTSSASPPALSASSDPVAIVGLPDGGAAADPSALTAKPKWTGKPRPGGGVVKPQDKPHDKPPAPTSSATMPDDISHNPYR